jgi:hypothetical protein
MLPPERPRETCPGAPPDRTPPVSEESESDA